LTTRPSVITAATVGTSSAQALAAQPRNYLLIANPSAAATVYIQFGSAAAVVNGAGTIALGPGLFHEWQGLSDQSAFVPSDAIQAIASAAATPLTIIT
jgi:hypothetical protein